MSGLSLTLKSAPSLRLDLSALTADKIAGLAADAVARMPLASGRETLTVGDVFKVSACAGDALVIAPGHAKLDFVGAGQKSGTLIVEGDVGDFAGRLMAGGRLEIKGSTGTGLASRMAGGRIEVAGSAGSNVGGVRAGDRFGMTGGIVIVEKGIGERAGDRMRRGTIFTRGTTGAGAGTRMMGGTIWTEGGFGDGPGPLLRRGTLIGPSASKVLSTYADCGVHDLVVLRLLSRYMAAELGAKAPKALPKTARKLAGDMATIGKGELLLVAA